jgi:ribosomal protein L14
MGTNFYTVRNPCSETIRAKLCRILTIIFLLSTGFLPASAQTSSLSFTQLSTDFPAPGRGCEQWGTTDWDNINVPLIPAGNAASMNSYQRFVWGQIETAQGVYSFTDFDGYVNRAIAKGQMFSFGVMAMCSSCDMMPTYGYPTYVHNLMAAESQPDWHYSGNGYDLWVPNWNSPSYQSRYAALLNALAAHINSSSYNGVPYKNVIYYVDIRGYGDFGEWHTYPWVGTEPAGRAATETSLETIVNANKSAFPNNQLIIPMGAFDTDPGHSSRLPAQFGYYVLTTSNNYGQIGWRRDNYGDPQYNSWLTASPGSYNGNQFTPLILNKYKYAPIGGEPNNGLDAVSTCGSPYCDLLNEVTSFHVSSFGNGNYPGLNTSNSAFVANILGAAKTSGYRLVLTGGSISSTLSSGSAFNITLNWQNIGIAPVYENWNVVYELRDASGKVAWTGNSAFVPRLFEPGAATPASDNFTLGTVTAGTYNMYLIVRDPVGYKKPLPLAVSGRNADGSYLLKSNITVGTGSGNQAPTANAGSNQTIQMPAATASLTGTGKDADGTISTYAWTKQSGPGSGTISSASTANTNVTGLVQGVYVFNLTVTDNQGATATASVQVTIQAAAVGNQPPVANAGSGVTITLPTSTANLNGSSSSDPDGSIASYAWTKISGPAQFSIANSSTASTGLSNLVAGVYSFQLKVTDNAGATALDTVKVTVNAAAAQNQPPVANAGADVNLILPANVTNLNGTLSGDPDGSIASYAWTKISGPAQINLTNAGAVTAKASNLVQGIYTFALLVTDNAGATASDTVKVTVNAAVAQNQSPVANAGTNITVTSPANTANLNGTASKDPDGTISAYAWSQSSGPSAAAIASPATASSGISGLQQGVYNFVLKVTDNSGATGTDSVTVTVNAAANKPPAANAGSSKSITLPTNSVSLDGSLSSDPDGSIASYSWSQISGPSASRISNGSQAAATAGNLVAGQYIFELIVTDNSGVTAKAQVKINVAASGLQPPISNAGTNQTITLPTNSVVIDGSGSAASSGNSITSYVWTEGSGPSSIALTNTAQNTLNNLVAGTYVFYLAVTDNHAGVGIDSVIIQVNAASNKAPVANAGPGVAITLPVNTATLDGSASSDPDGTISSYSWTEVSGPNTPPVTGANTASLNLSGLIAGQYTYQLKVTDNNGASSTAQVKIIVAPAPNQLPYANAGSNQTITAPASTVNLDGSASYDPDGSITVYSWTKVSGPGSVTISNSNTATPSVIGLQPGTYVFELTVTDNKAATAKDQVTITVNPKPAQPNQNPAANAGNDLTITLPLSSITLNATHSFDPDGTIAAYSWAQTSGPSTSSISAANSATPTVSGLSVVGQYVFKLTVTDNDGATNDDWIAVNVNPAAPKGDLAPLADAGSSDTLDLPVSNYLLDASRSSDPDGTITSYQWEEISGPNTVTSTSMNASKVNVSNLQAGVYEFQVTVTDDRGATAVASMKIFVMQGSVAVDRLVIYPNPAHDVINGRITSSVRGTVRVNIYDMNGRAVLTDQIEKSGDVVEKTFTVSQLASGMYTIRVSIGNRKTLVRKFIKN